CYFYYLPLIYHFFFNDTATTEIYTLSLHDALPISIIDVSKQANVPGFRKGKAPEKLVEEKLNKEQIKEDVLKELLPTNFSGAFRSEEHTSELQSRGHLVCRLLLEKKNKGKLGELLH